MRTLLVLLAVVFISLPAAATEMTIAGVKGFSENEAGTVILTEAYRRIGITLKVKRFVGKHALEKANKGRFAGDLQRIDAIKTKYKNLIQVRPAINYLEASVFTDGLEFEVNGWESLRPYKIGIFRGMKFAEINTEGMNRTRAPNYQTLFKLLDKGAVDLVVLPRVNGLYQRTKFGFDTIKDLKPALLRIDLYHYVHTKNRQIIPRLSAAIDDMRDKGELQAMRDAATETLIAEALEARE
jgi:polar amino acid transport system substrate-binding protein